jgi:hypothetical protein
VFCVVVLVFPDERIQVVHPIRVRREQAVVAVARITNKPFLALVDDQTMIERLVMILLRAFVGALWRQVAQRPRVCLCLRFGNLLYEGSVLTLGSGSAIFFSGESAGSAGVCSSAGASMT